MNDKNIFQEYLSESNTIYQSFYKSIYQLLSLKQHFNQKVPVDPENIVWNIVQGSTVRRSKHLCILFNIINIVKSYNHHKGTGRFRLGKKSRPPVPCTDLIIVFFTTQHLSRSLGFQPVHYRGTKHRFTVFSL